MHWTRPDPSRRITGRRALAIAGAVALLGVLAFKVWYDATTDASHWVAVVDELPIPASWTVAGEETRQDLLWGSNVTRYYFVDADPQEIADALRTVYASVGFGLDPHRSFGCDRNPREATTGPVTCSMGARRGADYLWITIYDRGQRADYSVGDERHILRSPNRAILRIKAGDRY